MGVIIKNKLVYSEERILICLGFFYCQHISRLCKSRAEPHLSDLLLFKVVSLDHNFTLKRTTVPVKVDSLLGQEEGLFLGLGMLHVLLVLGQTLLLLLLRCAVVLVHLLLSVQLIS